MTSGTGTGTVAPAGKVHLIAHLRHRGSRYGREVNGL